MKHGLVSSYPRHRFAVLFYSLLLTLLVDPLLEALGFHFHLLETLFALNLLAAALSIAFEKGAHWFSLAAGAGVVSLLAASAFGDAAFKSPSLGLWSLLCVVAATATLRHALRRGAVNAERIYAALSVYLLAGLIFGVVYWILAQQWPGSFTVPAGATFTLARSVYFSFVTLATLGYGDFAPLNEAARAFAVIEAMGGQMYLTVLVARLVSLYAVDHRSGSEENDAARHGTNEE